MYKWLLILLLTLPVQAHNLLKRNGFYYAIDYENLTKVKIDNSFTPNFKTSMEAFLKEYFDVPISFEDLNPDNARQLNVLTILNMRDEDYSSCNCGGLWSSGTFGRRVNNSILVQKSYIVTRENFNTFRHEIGHALGLDHDTRLSKAIERRRKPLRWVNQNDLLLSDQIMTVDKGRQRQFTPMDNIIFKVLSNKNTDYGIIEGQLNETSPMGLGDVMFVNLSKQGIPHIVYRKVNKKKNGTFDVKTLELRHRYMTTMEDDGSFLTMLPTGEYRMFHVPEVGKPKKMNKFKIQANTNFNLLKNDVKIKAEEVEGITIID